MANIKLPKGISKKDLVKKLKHEKAVAYKYQKRRHQHWLEIYELYRDIVRVNRLTQRQAINIPLMKETIKTILSKIGETPDVHFESLSGELDKEIVINQLWKTSAEKNDFELQDRVDKKQEQLYGRSHMALNVGEDGEVTMETKDIYALLVDPKTIPYDIETARFTVDTDIFKSLDEILISDKYDEEAKVRLKQEYETNKTSGSQKTSKYYQEQMLARNERMKSLGIADPTDLEGFDKVVALDGHITHIWDSKEKKFVRYYVLVANESIILRADTLLETIGVEFYPYEGWADDLELTDYWSDGTGDLVRVPNKTINIWISQHMENRTLRSFGMNYYDSTIEGFTPPTHQPRPAGWYPLPGKPREVFQKVEVPQLSGSLEDIQFITNIAERASATGAVEKGAVEDVKRTLGEIEIAVGNAQRRTNDMAIYYETSRRKFAEKWYKMVQANTPAKKKIKLYKKLPDGSTMGRDVVKEDWEDEEGFKVVVQDRQKRIVDKTENISLMIATQKQYPDNAPLNKAIQKRMITILDLSPQEMEEIEQYEIDKAEATVTGKAPEEQGVRLPANIEAEVEKIGGAIAG